MYDKVKIEFIWNAPETRDGGMDRSKVMDDQMSLSAGSESDCNGLVRVRTGRVPGLGPGPVLAVSIRASY